MLIPTKHTNFSYSLLGFGSYIIEILKTSPVAVDELWDRYQEDLKEGRYYFKHSIENLVLSITFLYAIGLIEEKNGKIYLEKTLCK